MANAVKQSKLAKISTVELQEVIEQVDLLAGEIDKLNEQASEEILKVEQKFNKQRQPLCQQRSELLSQIPNFWITVLVNHPQIASLVSDVDEELLQHLAKVEVQEFDDIKSGYKITLYFNKNEFFKNESIVKEFRRNEAGELSTKSSTVEWAPGKNILAKSCSSHEAAAKGGERKRKHEDDSSASLMRWFISDQLGEDGLAYAEVDELGEIIKDEIWSNPLQFYLAADEEVNQLDQQGDDGDDAGPEGEDVLGEQESEELGGDEEHDDPEDVE